MIGMPQELSVAEGFTIEIDLETLGTLSPYVCVNKAKNETGIP
jgi:hypothetical protein